MYSLYPEEFNRQAVVIGADYNFAPTEILKQNVIKEGKNPSSIIIAGNKAGDALKNDGY